MSLRRALTCVAAATVLALVLAACSPKAPTGAAGTSADGTSASRSGVKGEAIVTVSLGDIPSEPGVAWDMARYEGAEPLPVQLQVAGPWTFTAGDGWARYTSEIVDPASVPEIGGYSGYDFVLKAPEGASDAYYVRKVADGWMTQLGKVTVTDGQASSGAYGQPMKLWPVDMEIGGSYPVADSENFRVDATVLSRNTVTVPAGTISDAYLVRFVFTPKAEGGIEGTQYYVLAPGVGVVAMFSAAAGDEATGFTALQSETVLVTMPGNR